MALLFSFKTPADMFATGGSVPLGPPAPSVPAGTMPPATEPPSTVSPPTEPPASHSPATDPPTAIPAQQILTGQSVRTPYGPVQVQVTLAAGTISDVQALALPFDRSYSARVSRYVEPILRDEALRAQSANINLISGATYTSKGYAMSLQSALDQAS